MVWTCQTNSTLSPNWAPSDTQNFNLKHNIPGNIYGFNLQTSVNLWTSKISRWQNSKRLPSLLNLLFSIFLCWKREWTVYLAKVSSQKLKICWKENWYVCLFVRQAELTTHLSSTLPNIIIGGSIKYSLEM